MRWTRSTLAIATVLVVVDLVIGGYLIAAWQERYDSPPGAGPVSATGVAGTGAGSPASALPSR